LLGRKGVDHARASAALQQDSTFWRQSSHHQAERIQNRRCGRPVIAQITALRIASGPDAPRFCDASLPTEDEVYPGKDELQIAGGEASDALGQQRAVDGQDLRDLRDGVFGKSGALSVEEHVAGRDAQAQVACEGHYDGRGDAARIEALALYHRHRSPERRTSRAGDPGIEPGARVLETPMLPIHQSPKGPIAHCRRV
jgi:hypothetical protein